MFAKLIKKYMSKKIIKQTFTNVILRILFVFVKNITNYKKNQSIILYIKKTNNMLIFLFVV